MVFADELLRALPGAALLLLQHVRGHLEQLQEEEGEGAAGPAADTRAAAATADGTAAAATAAAAGGRLRGGVARRGHSRRTKQKGKGI